MGLGFAGNILGLANAPLGGIEAAEEAVAFNFPLFHHYLTYRHTGRFV